MISTQSFWASIRSPIVSPVVAAVRESIPCKDVFVGYIGPIIGASIGPDAVALFAFGDEITLRIGDK